MEENKEILNEELHVGNNEMAEELLPVKRVRKARSPKVESETTEESLPVENEVTEESLPVKRVRKARSPKVEPEVTEEPLPVKRVRKTAPPRGDVAENDVTEEPLPVEPEATEETLSVEPEVAEEPLPVEPEATEEPLPVEPEATEEPLPVEPEATEEPLPVEPEATEEPLPAEPELEKPESQEALLTDDAQEEVADVSDEVAAEFDKELLSAKVQPEQVEETEAEAEVEVKEEEEAEIIPDYHSYEPEALIEALEALLHEDALETIKGRVSAIKLAFLDHEKVARAAAKAAGQETKEDADEQTEAFVFPLSERFNAVFDLYRQKKAKFMEDLEKEKEANLEQKNTILEELRALLVSEQPLKVTYDRFRELQEQWKGIGLVPKQEIATLWNNYHFLIEKFFDKVRIHRELKELDLKKNLELKIALCEKAEELLLEDKVIDAFKKLQQLHTQWREIGAVPNAQRIDIWERFKLVSDTIYQRHHEYIDILRGEHESNAQAKTAICEKVEEIAAQTFSTVNEWGKKNDEINELFKLWKSIGPVGRKQSTDLWSRFSKAMDTFYANKKEFLQKIKELTMDNYNQKLNICVEAEALKDSTEWKNTTKEFMRLQEEWKNIGPVPVKLSDKIWKRFRAACDHFFTTKEAHFSNIAATQPENLKAKENIIKELKECDFSGLRVENLELLKDFQNRWFSIGFVPFKEKERLQTEYRQVLNEKMRQLNISSYEVNEGRPYKEGNQNFAGRRNEGGNETGLRKEIIYMQNKVAAMQDEINLWENNIGFLSSSKNADILKQEFEKKIQKAKNDLELNVAKLRYLRQELAKEEDKK